MEPERDESTPKTSRGPESATGEIDHDLRVRRAFLEASRVPRTHRDRHLDALPADLVAEVRELLAYVSSVDDVEPASDPDQWYGRRVGDWTLGVEIGAGGHGRVFKATDSQGRRAAVKILHASGPDMATRLDREVAALQSLEHPGIVGVLDHGVLTAADAERTIAFVAIELVDDGEPLLDWAVRVRPDRDARLDLIEQVLTALAHAHARGVVHRDLKSSNVLVDDAGVTHLIDFGIARLTDPDGAGAGLHATETRERNTIVGSLSHLAPEQVDRRLGPVAPATDVHAVGLLAYRLLCGEPPYDATGSVVQAIQAVLHVPPADPAIFDPEMPRDLADWLLACLAKDPTTRPADAGVALSMLRAAHRRPDDSPIPGHTTGGGHGLRVAVVAVTVVAITAVAIVAATALRSGDVDHQTDPTTNQAVRQDPGAGDSEMKLRPILGAVVGSALVTVNVSGQDPVQWRIEDGGNGHWYRLILADTSCFDAHMEIAEQLGAHLVTLTSQSETDFVGSYFVTNPSISTFALGARRSPATGGQWEWITGEPWAFTAWGGQGCTTGPYPNNGSSAFQIRAPACPGPPESLHWDDFYQTCWPPSGPFNLMVEWDADCNSDGIVDYGQIIDGTFTDSDGNGVPDCCDAGVPDECENLVCIGDITGNGRVDAADLGILLAVWNTAGKSNPEADINGDGTVNATDLGLLLVGWGPCPD